MGKPIFTQDFWDQRLADAIDRGKIHHAVYICTDDKWEKVNAAHKNILREVISANDSILDAGCGWGRLLSLLPPAWHGDYLGVDLCEAFIKHARAAHPERCFLIWDLRQLSRPGGKVYDWGILISIKPMVIREASQEVWDAMESNLCNCCNKLLLLEYDEKDKGEILICN